MSSQHGASQSGPSCGPKSADEMTLPLGNQGARDGGACCRTINGASSDTSSSILSGSSSPALLLRSRRGVSFRRPLRYDAPHGASARSRHAVLSSPNSRPSSRELRRTVSLRTATADADATSVILRLGPVTISRCVVARPPSTTATTSVPSVMASGIRASSARARRCVSLRLGSPVGRHARRDRQWSCGKRTPRE